MDGRLSQFAAHLSSQVAENKEIIGNVEGAMTRLFETYKDRNSGKMPATVIVFRDGVSDGQFQQVV